ncbi:anti-sigma factor family protein [Actinomadura harenae]|uniref:anti-sigma factor family protein n=1 Tax=Actinomadura harenae TaxID=2483351 RepID=UPI0026C60752
MSCLGERLTALVDGELGHEERERALRHLAGCAPCRVEADALRRLKARLRGLATPPGTSAPERGLPGLPDLTVPDLTVPGLHAPGLNMPGLNMPGLNASGGSNAPDSIGPDLGAPDLINPGLSDPASPGLPGAGLPGLGAPGLPIVPAQGYGQGPREAGADRAASSADVPDDMPTPDFLARLRGLGETLAAADGPADTAPGASSPASRNGGPRASGEPAASAADTTRPDELSDLGELGGPWGPSGARNRTPWVSPSGGTTRPGRPRDNRPPVSAGGGRGRRSGVPSGPMAGATALMSVPAGSVRAGRTHRRRYLAVGAASLFLGLGVASYVAGGEQDAPTVTPAFDRFAVQHALTSGDSPITDPLTDPGTLRTAVPSAPEP